MHFLTTFAALLSVANAIPHVRSELNIARDDDRTAPASHEVTFGSVAFAGSGCPASTVSSQLSSDVSTFTFLFSKFIAQAGQDVDASEYRKNCQLSTKIRYPSGWQFSVYKADYRGYAKIPAGTTGTAKATYYFSGESDQVSSEMVINGVYNGNYVKTDKFAGDAALWSPCGSEGLLNINSEVRLTPLDSDASAILTGNLSDQKYTVVHYLQWRRC